MQPGHIFPLQAQDGGVLMRAGHTEAGCDLAGMAGLTPAAVICEVMKDDGTMARLPDLEVFAHEHGLKIGTIADLIEHRSRNESLIERAAERPLETAQGEFTARLTRPHRRPAPGAGCTASWTPPTRCWCACTSRCRCWTCSTPGRARTRGRCRRALDALQAARAGVAVLLNCGETGADLLSRARGRRSARARQRGRMDLRTYGVGAQILREFGVTRMKLLGSPRRMPSMAGYGLEVTGFIDPVDELEAPSACRTPTRAAAPRLDGNGLRIGIVQARFNDAITTKLAEACLAELRHSASRRKHIGHVTVPGALEVPIALQALAEPATTTTR